MTTKDIGDPNAIHEGSFANNETEGDPNIIRDSDDNVYAQANSKTLKGEEIKAEILDDPTTFVGISGESNHEINTPVENIKFPETQDESYKKTYAHQEVCPNCR